MDREALKCALREKLEQSSDARVLHRLHCVLLVAQGHSATDVANWFGNTPSTVARWVRHFKVFGTAGLVNGHRTGRQAKLSHVQLSALQRDLNQAPLLHGYDETHWHGRLVAAHMEQRFNVVLSVRQCQRLLRQVHQPAAKVDKSTPGNPSR